MIKKPKIVHQEAMDYSFKAKKALEEGNFNLANDLYKKSANSESKVAEFYFNKPDLEPTRSIVIRSAAFLNIKAGLIENAKKFIFFGLLNIDNQQIKDQLNNALEIGESLNHIASAIEKQAKRDRNQKRIDKVFPYGSRKTK